MTQVSFRNFTGGIFVKSNMYIYVYMCMYIYITYFGWGLGHQNYTHSILIGIDVGVGGLEVTCSPRDPRFAGSNPAEVVGFFQNVKILSTSPPGGTLSRGFRV